jgi:hypothetical protein
MFGWVVVLVLMPLMVVATATVVWCAIELRRVRRKVKDEKDEKDEKAQPPAVPDR